MLPGGPLLPLTPPLPGMPAITTPEIVPPDDFRLFYQSDVRLFRPKRFGHLSDRAKKIEIDKALILEHYIYNKVFVSREGVSAFWVAAARHETIRYLVSSVLALPCFRSFLRSCLFALLTEVKLCKSIWD